MIRHELDKKIPRHKLELIYTVHMSVLVIHKDSISYNAWNGIVVIQKYNYSNIWLHMVLYKTEFKVQIYTMSKHKTRLYPKNIIKRICLLITTNMKRIFFDTVIFDGAFPYNSLVTDYL